MSTPISRAPIKKQWQQKLINLNLDTAESVAAIVMDDVHRGRLYAYLLEHDIGQTTAALDEFLAPFIDSYRHAGQLFCSERYCLGLIKKSDKNPSSKSLDFSWLNTVTFKPEVSLVEYALRTPVLDQGNRGSCCACAAAKSIELDWCQLRPDQAKRAAPQYIYFHSKLIDGFPNVEGTDFSSITKALQEFGTCYESEHPYQISAANNVAGDPPSERALKSGQKHKTGPGVLQLSDRAKVLGVKAALSGILTGRKKSVIVGIDLFETFFTCYVHASGKVSLPIPNERCLGSHAILIVGYEDNRAPGGGEFIAVNSWGASWGNGGLAKIPYQYLLNHANSFAVITQPTEEAWWSTSDLQLRHSALTHRGFIELGTSLTGEPYYWQSSNLANDSVLIVGGSGEGKTSVTKSMLYQRIQAEPDLTVHILDQHDEYGEFVTFFNGTFIDVSEQGLPFDLLDNPRPNLDIDLFVDELLGCIADIAPWVGCVQLNKIKHLLTSALLQGANNPQLRQILEHNDDGKIGAHMRAICLLLKKSAEKGWYFKKGIFVHSLGHMKNPTTRAAYTIFLLSRLLDCRDVKKPETLNKTVVVIEESSKLAKAETVLQRNLLEGRKYLLSTIFIAHPGKLSEYMLNATTKIYYREAIKFFEKNSIAEHEMPHRFEAKVYSDQREVIIRPKTMPEIDKPPPVQINTEADKKSFNQISELPTYTKIEKKVVPIQLQEIPRRLHAFELHESLVSIIQRAIDIACEYLLICVWASLGGLVAFCLLKVL